MNGKDFYCFDSFDDDHFLKDNESEWVEFDDMCRKAAHELQHGKKEPGMGLEFGQT